MAASMMGVPQPTFITIFKLLQEALITSSKSVRLNRVKAPAAIQSGAGEAKVKAEKTVDGGPKESNSKQQQALTNQMLSDENLRLLLFNLMDREQELTDYHKEIIACTIYQERIDHTLQSAEDIMREIRDLSKLIQQTSGDWKSHV
jgi:hypothetical protein